MAIKVNRPPEPFTAGSREKNGKARWAGCKAYDQIYLDIERYAQGSIRGRSVLVAGHRGSGKTLITQLAIEDAQKRSEEDGSLYKAFPLYVPLHGPDFLRPPEISIRQFQRANDDKLMQNALQEIVKSLYRALSNQVSDRYLQKAREASIEPDNAKRAKPNHVASEVAHQLRLQLDKKISLKELYHYWSEINKQNEGVFPKYSGIGERHDADKGLREIVALYTAGQVLNAIEEAQVGDQGNADPIAGVAPGFQKRTVGVLIEKAGPMISLLPGGALAYALLEKAGPGASALAFVAVSILTWGLLKRVNESLVEQPVTDTSVASMDRMLPELVQRCLHAGIAPVFVVDELDKVAQVEENLPVLMRHLKHLVSDEALFIFLADRSYFELLQTEKNSHPFPESRTYFTEKILVFYTPEQIRQHIASVLEANPTTDGAGSANQNPSDASSTQDLSPQTGSCTKYSDTDEVKLKWLPYLLAHMSRLHPVNLWDVIEVHTDKAGYMQVEGSFWTQNRFLYAVMMQLAIEEVEKEPKLQNWMKQHPNVAHFVYDALYYPTRRWIRGEDFMLGEDHLEAYLSERATGKRLDAQQKPTLVGAKPNRSSIEAKRFTRNQLKVLSDSVSKLARHLAEPSEVEKRLQELMKNAAENEQHAMLAPLVAKTSPVGRSRTWNFDEMGNVPHPGHRITTDIQIVNRVDQLLRDGSSPGTELASLSILQDNGVIRSQVDWRRIQTAMNNWLTARNTENDGAETEEINLIIEYHRGLRDQGETLKAVLLWQACRKRSIGPGRLSDVPWMTPSLCEDLTKRLRDEGKLSPLQRFYLDMMAFANPKDLPSWLPHAWGLQSLDGPQ